MATQKSTYFAQYGGSTSEQGLAQDLIDEHIKIHGSTVYYLPRTLNNVDNIFHETTTASFTAAVEIEMYMKSYDKFDGIQDDTITRFGLRSNDALTFVVSKRRWQEEFDGNFAGQLADDRPAEGDLIYFPLSRGLFEVKYVEHQTDMYQLGNFYAYELRCELFEYSDEEIETGVDEIDGIELEQSASIKMFMDPGGTGDFIVGEEVVGDEFLAKATATTDGNTITLITISDGGAHYKTALPPTVTITGGGGTGATATATVSSTGIVSGIVITDVGNGYTSSPTVTIDYSPKDNRAEVKSWDSTTRKLEVVNRTGIFTTAETITGLTSGAKWSPESYDQVLPLNNTNDPYDQSYSIEVESDNIIDFTEINPFGEF